MNQQFALAIGIVAPESDGVTPGGDVHLKDPEFAVVDSRVTSGDLSRSFAQGLDLRAHQNNAALQGLENVKVVSGTTIGGHDLVVARVLTQFRPAALNDFGSCHQISVVT